MELNDGSAHGAKFRFAQQQAQLLRRSVGASCDEGTAAGLGYLLTRRS